MQHRWKSVLKNGVKLAVCGTVVAAIGFAFIVLTPDGSVEEADADLFWTSPGDFSTNQEKFIDVLEDQGFSEPEPYEWNDNIVYFSHGETDEAPREVSERVQRALVDVGLNEQMYPVPPNPNSIEHAYENDRPDKEQIVYASIAAQDFVDGGMIPMIDTGDKVALSGIDTALQHGEIQDKYDLDDLPAFMAMMSSYGGDDMADLIENVRYVEAFRPHGSSRTQKVAMFGEEDLNLRNFTPGGGSADVGDDLIPACPGCERNTNFAGAESQQQYRMQSYNTSHAAESVVDFYRRAMVERGWELSTGIGLVEQFRADRAPSDADDMYGEMLTFVHDSGDIAQIHVYEGDNRQTQVNVFRGD